MYVLVNASVRGEITFLLLMQDGTTKEARTYSGQNKDVMTALVQFFSDTNISKDDVRGIGLVEGVGGFTSTRIATLVANAFSYVQQLSVIAISQAEFASPTQVLIERFTAQTPGALLHPTYSGEPNIRM